MNTHLIVVFPRGQLSEADKARMQEVGIIAIEADDPKSVQQLQLTQPLVNTAISGDAVVSAALHAIADHGGNDTAEMARASLRFVKRLSAALEAVNRRADGDGVPVPAGKTPPPLDADGEET